MKTLRPRTLSSQLRQKVRNAKRILRQPFRRLKESDSITVGYVLSMKNGMPSFNEDELRELELRGVPFVVYATKKNHVSSVTQLGWSVRSPSLRSTISGLAHFVICRPTRFARAASEAIRRSLWIEFLVAVGFAEDMARNGVVWIHAHFADKKILIARLASILIDKPYSVTVHAHELYSNLKRPARADALKGASRIFAVSDFNREVLVRDWEIPAANIRTNRLIVGRSHTEPRSQARMLVVGNWVEKKGYDVLLEAIKDIPSSELITWIIGSGPLKLDRYVKNFGLDGRVVLLGRVSHETLGVFLDACDFFCLPSRTSSTGEKEGFPMVLAEAMAHSKPTVTTRHAGIPEVVREILVPEGDPKALRQGIREMLLRRSQWVSMGRENRKLALEYFSRKNIDVLVENFGVKSA